MEIPQGGKLDLKEILLRYGTRKSQSDKQLPEREDLNIDKENFNKNLSKSAETSFQVYLQRQDEEGILAGDTQYEKTNNILLHTEVLDPSVPLSLVTMLSKSVWKKDGSKGKKLDFRLFRGTLGKEEVDKLISDDGGNGIAHFYYPIHGNVLDMRHREVNPAFRRQGLGDAMLKLTEEFLQKKATVEQKEQAIEATTSQLDVICWLWNNGFRPKEKKDQENLEMIISGDKDLYLEEELHVGPTEESGLKSVRLIMEKKVYPSTSQEVGDKKTEVRLAIDKIVPL